MELSYFHDRRPHAAPEEGDFLQPITRQSVAEANARLRLATPEYQRSGVDAAIRDQAAKRHRARASGRGDFPSVGDYLAHFSS